MAGITAATIVKATPGRIVIINVAIAGSGSGAVYDAISTTGITLGTTTTGLIASIPDTVGQITLNYTTNNGIVIFPGTGQTLSVVYS